MKTTKRSEIWRKVQFLTFDKNVAEISDKKPL